MTALVGNAYLLEKFKEAGYEFNGVSACPVFHRISEIAPVRRKSGVGHPIYFRKSDVDAWFASRACPMAIDRLNARRANRKVKKAREIVPVQVQEAEKAPSGLTVWFKNFAALFGIK